MSIASTVLARRFGYGPAGPQPVAPAGLLAGLQGPDEMQSRFPGAGRDEIAARREEFVRQRASDRSGSLRVAQAAMREIEDRALPVALARIAETDTPFRERLAWFWSDHFTVRARRPLTRGLPVDFHESAIRPRLAGRFADLLKAAVTHPAMVAFLDQGASVGPMSRAARSSGRGLNENLAREVLELHTLGVVAGYAQADVREFAELLTGLVVDADRPFRPRLAQPGSETVLGRSYGGPTAALDDILAALDDLARHPATAAHIARKLAVHFVADDPPADLIDRMAAAFSTSQGDLAAVYEVLLTHPAASAPTPQKARQPFEYIGAALRALAVPGQSLVQLAPAVRRRILLRPLVQMAQPFLAPAGPDGWAEATLAWLTPQGLAARIVWAMQMPGQLLPDLPDPVHFARLALADDAGAALLTAVGRAPTRAEGIGLVLASPAFNVR